MQLPPFTKWGKASKHYYDVSLLQRLASTAPSQHNLMTVQYRMHPSLANIVSSTFYKGALTTAPAIEAKRTRPTPVLFVDVDGHELSKDNSFLNDDEVKAVIKLAVHERASHPGALINIITFYKPQMKAISKAVASHAALSKLVDVSTVDSMQGREADVVILSCVRTSVPIGFLKDQRRLNVAISRAKDMMYMVGNHTTLLNAGSGAWTSVLTHGNMATR